MVPFRPGRRKLQIRGLPLQSILRKYVNPVVNPHLCNSTSPTVRKKEITTLKSQFSAVISVTLPPTHRIMQHTHVWLPIRPVRRPLSEYFGVHTHVAFRLYFLRIVYDDLYYCLSDVVHLASLAAFSAAAETNFRNLNLAITRKGVFGLSMV